MFCKCHGTGWVIAVQKKSGATYSFRCGCEVSDRRNISKNIPCWNHQLADEFEVDGLPHLSPSKAAPEIPPAPPEPIKKDYKILAADPHYYDDLENDSENIPF